MAQTVLTKTRIHAGRWEGVLEMPASGVAPDLEVSHLGTALSGVVLEPEPVTGHWRVSVPIPAELLCDGVQTFVIGDRAAGLRLASFSIITGAPLDDDIRAEIDLLRAEMELLRTAFRRHCAESLAATSLAASGPQDPKAG